MTTEILELSECPGCRAPAGDSVQLFQTSFSGASCSVVRCSCGLVYKTKAPQAGAMKSIYSAGYVHFQDPALKLGAADRNSAKQKLDRCRTLLPSVPSPGGWKLLDVGCGAGYFVSMARDLGYDAQGLDAFLPEGLENKHLHRGSLEDAAPESYDIISLLNVAEHLVDPKPLFAAIYRALKPQGVLLLTCPYGASLALHFFKNQWIHLALDEHLLFWTPESLTGLLRRTGFKGSVSYRIAGSPFPFGRVKSAQAPPGQAQEYEEPANDGLQRLFWKLARWIQQQEQTANAVRALVHGSRTGDYLEYGIQKNRAG